MLKIMHVYLSFDEIFGETKFELGGGGANWGLGRVVAPSFQQPIMRLTQPLLLGSDKPPATGFRPYDV